MHFKQFYNLEGGIFKVCAMKEERCPPCFILEKQCLHITFQDEEKYNSECLLSNSNY